MFPPSWLEHIPFAFWIVDALRPSVFVELGTNSGNSYAAFAQAIQTLRLPAAAYAVDTWLGDPQAGFYDEAVFTDWSAYHDRRFSSFSRLVRSTFAEAAEGFVDGGVDLLHIDGCHTFDAITADFELWRPKMSGRGVVLLHDINVREGDFGAWRFWERVQEQYPSIAFLHGRGLGVLGLGADLPEPVAWLLSHASADPRNVMAIRTLFARLGGIIASRYAEQSLRAEVAEKSARLTGAYAEVERLTALAAQHQEARRLLDGDNGGPAAAHQTEATAELTALRVRVDAAENAQTEMRAQTAAAQTDAESARAEIAAARAEASAACSQRDIARIAARRAAAASEGHWRARITELEQRAAEAAQQAGQAARQAADAEQQAATAQQRVADAEQQAATAQQRAVDAEQQVATAQQRAVDAEQQVAKAQQQAVGAEQQAAQWRHQYEALRARRERFLRRSWVQRASRLLPASVRRFVRERLL